MLRVFWLLQHVSHVPDDDTWLSASEREVVARLWAPKRRRDWRLGRWTAKRALARADAAEPRIAGFRETDLASWPVVSIHPNESGAPCVVGERGDAPWLISLSHSGEHGLCAVAAPPAALGCDVETIGRRGEEFVVDWFTEEERGTVRAAGTADAESRVVTLIWSAKESALKALGVGLRLDTRQVEVNLTGTGEITGRQGWSPLRVQAPDSVLEGWWRSDGERVVTIVADPAPDVPVAL